MIRSEVHPGGSAGKESTCNAGGLGSIPGLGRSPGEVKGYPLQYSGLENSMDCIIHGVAKTQTRLSDFHFLSLSLSWNTFITKSIIGLYWTNEKSPLFQDFFFNPVQSNWWKHYFLEQRCPKYNLYIFDSWCAKQDLNFEWNNYIQQQN